MPNGGNGRVYFRLGSPQELRRSQGVLGFHRVRLRQRHLARQHHAGRRVLHPADDRAGRQKSRHHRVAQQALRDVSQEAPKEFKDCVKGDYWILSPRRAGFGKDGPQGKYFDKYVDEVWDNVRPGKEDPERRVDRQGRQRRFDVHAGRRRQDPPSPAPGSPARRRSSWAPACSAAIRSSAPPSTATCRPTPPTGRNAAKFYQAEPCNWYSKFLHEHSIDHKAYGFCYDDVSEQAAFFSGKGANVIVTLSWDAEPSAKPAKG